MDVRFGTTLIILRLPANVSCITIYLKRNCCNIRDKTNYMDACDFLLLATD